MKHLVLVAALSLIVAPAALAGWGVVPGHIDLQAGSAYDAHVGWVSGLVVYPAHYVFTSDNPAVAVVTGEFVAPGNMPSTSGVVTITAVSSGVAHVISGSQTFATITVTAAQPVLPVVAVPGANVPIATDGPGVDLQVVTTDGEPIVCEWFYGRSPDTSYQFPTNALDSCTHHFAAPSYAGFYFVWARATSATAAAVVDFTMDVIRPRIRPSRH